MRVRRSCLLAIPIVLGGCAPALPFSTPSPGLDVLTAESEWLDRPSGFSPDGVAGSDMPEVRQRVENLVEVYRGELRQAEAARGGAFNALMKIAGLALPVSGTAVALLVSDTDDAAAIAAGAAAATTIVAALNTFLKPGERAEAASSCEAFLRDALRSLEARWPESRRAAIPNDATEWDVYFAVRSGLEAGRRASCSE